MKRKTMEYIGAALILLGIVGPIFLLSHILQVGNYEQTKNFINAVNLAGIILVIAGIIVFCLVRTDEDNKDNKNEIKKQDKPKKILIIMIAAAIFAVIVGISLYTGLYKDLMLFFPSVVIYLLVMYFLVWKKTII